MTANDKELAMRAQKVTEYSTEHLVHILGDGHNRSYEHYHFIAVQREFQKRLRKRKK